MTTGIVSQIKAKVDPADHDLTTAEGRTAFDDALRAELEEIKDHKLRAHAVEMLKAWRRDLFGQIDHHTIHQLSARVAAVEARLGIAPQEPVEIHSLWAGGEDG